ncbi:MAG: molybdopterin-dependent oxidoreductase, partial [Bacteroidota bacterium]
KALMKRLLEKENQNPGQVLDADFITEKCAGFKALQEDLDNYELEKLIEQCGLSFTEFDKAAELIAQKKKIIICWAMGLTQHKNGVANIQECVNLLLMKGSIGKKGAGTCPVRGHSNVQGDRTMGIWEKPKKAFLDRLEEVCQFQPPRNPGWNTVESIQAMKEGKGKIFFALGGNFLSATPDTQLTSQALENCDCTIQVSTKLNRSHLHTGKEALILPCLGRTEIDQQASGKQFVSVENSMGVVHTSEGILAPASAELRSEAWIIARLAQATLGPDQPVKWMELVSDYDQIRDLIEKVIPGFENYNKRVRRGNGFYLPNGAREGKFHTASGKAHFTLNPLPNHQLEKGTFMMMTIRSHDQFNTTIYGLHDRYRGIHQARRVVMMHPEDIKVQGLNPLDQVQLSSIYNGEKRVAPDFRVVPYDIPRQCVATYFPEANVLVPLKHKADKSDTPASKSIIIRIEKV